MEQPRLLDRPASAVEHLTGVVERVVFHNDENGFTVLRLSVRGRRDLLTVVGHAPAARPGEFLQAEGTWKHDRTHGLQFEAASMQAVTPTTLEGIEKYLSSGLIKGIGPHLAGKLVEAFGTRVFEVVEHQPERLRTVGGIGRTRAESITSAWRDQKSVRDIMLFLHSHGVGSSRAVRIFKTYGHEAIPLITENPYRLAADIRGIGFLTADRIAASLGIDPQAMIRARAGIGYALTEAMDDGHCGLPLAVLKETASRLLEIPAPLIERAIQMELDAGTIAADQVEGREAIFLAGLYSAERAIALRIRSQATGPLPWPSIDADAALGWAERRLGMTLAPMQREAFSMALRTRFLVITGGPGVGKTTLLNAILAVLAAKRVRMALAAPTGRAAKRMSEATGREAKTIHRLLEVDPRTGGFRRQESNTLDCDLLVVDETSMVDVPLMHSLMRAVPPRAAVLLVGDVDQLPSVGPGRVLGDIIDSGAVPVVRLTEVFRQASASRIIVNAHRINAGEMPELTPSGADDFYFWEADEPEKAAQRLLQAVCERIPARFGLDPMRDVQVLCPMIRGVLGARSLNAELQKRLNPGREPRLERYGWTFSPGDRVMQVENDYDKDVYNGDLGFIRSIDPSLSHLTVDFDGRPVDYDVSDLDQLALAYATTIHKSQGSEYPAVVIPVSTQHYAMLQRNLLYTAVTRGRRLVVLVGQRKALGIAVSDRRLRRRWTMLRKWLTR
ncbi:MAG: ATP-dependent RecD-like DNA helicase [Acidobacteria bacterium]|nr:ATP-dependent RecD-like DNA helicase [Acidobacteriota bacterium]